MTTTSDSGSPRPRLSRGAAFGILFGGSFWALAFAILVLTEGSWLLLLECGLPVWLAAVAVSLLLLALLQWKTSLPAGCDGGQLLLMGGLWTALGLMLVLADGYVTPVLESNTRLAEAVLGTGGVLRLPIHLALAALVAGCTMLAIALRRLARAK